VAAWFIVFDAHHALASAMLNYNVTTTIKTICIGYFGERLYELKKSRKVICYHYYTFGGDHPAG
jgi:hypothetical protein